MTQHESKGEDNNIACLSSLLALPKHRTQSGWAHFKSSKHRVSQMILDPYVYPSESCPLYF